MPLYRRNAEEKRYTYNNHVIGLPAASKIAPSFINPATGYTRPITSQLLSIELFEFAGRRVVVSTIWIKKRVSKQYYLRSFFYEDAKGRPYAKN